MYVGGYTVTPTCKDLNYGRSEAMDKEICFCIEQENLYLEQVLVDYMDIPIFFLCKNNMRYYVALCTDIENLNYIVAEVSDVSIYNLLHGNIAMRTVFLIQNWYWEIISGDDISSDSVVKYDVNNLDVSLLPDGNACFKILTEETRRYVQNFDDIFFGMENFNATEQPVLWNPLYAESCNSLDDGDIETFISLGDYCFNASLDPLPEFDINFSDQYLSCTGKGTALKEHFMSDDWKNSDTINNAA